METNKKQMNLKLTFEDLDKLDHLARVENLTKTAVIEEALHAYFDEHLMTREKAAAVIGKAESDLQHSRDSLAHEEHNLEIADPRVLTAVRTMIDFNKEDVAKGEKHLEEVKAATYAVLYVPEAERDQATN